MIGFALRWPTETVENMLVECELCRRQIGGCSILVCNIDRFGGNAGVEMKGEKGRKCIDRSTFSTMFNENRRLGMISNLR